MDNEIIMPEFLEHESADEVLRRMISRLPDDIDVSEGSILYDLLVGVAKEKARMTEFQLRETLNVLFPQNAYSVYLDLHAQVRKMERHGATSSIATLIITGIPGTLIPEGFKFSTIATLDSSSIEFETLNETSIDETGNTQVLAWALIPGVIGNVPAKTITLMSKPISGIKSITNPERSTGGTEEESDDSLKQRILEHDASQDVSYCGSPEDYRRWARAVDGVGSVKVISAIDDSGLVTIVATDANGEPANEIIRQNIYNRIMRPDKPDERPAPINALLAVIAPTIISVSITARVILSPDVEVTDAIKRFKDNLLLYYPKAIEDGAIKYVHISATLANTVGIADFNDLLVNEGTANIALSKIDFPYTESVVFSIA